MYETEFAVIWRNFLFVDKLKSLAENYDDNNKHSNYPKICLVHDSFTALKLSQLVVKIISPRVRFT
jgi:hypothetical protein